MKSRSGLRPERNLPDRPWRMSPLTCVCVCLCVCLRMQNTFISKALLVFAIQFFSRFKGFLFSPLCSSDVTQLFICCNYNKQVNEKGRKEGGREDDRDKWGFNSGQRKASLLKMERIIKSKGLISRGLSLSLCPSLALFLSCCFVFLQNRLVYSLAAETQGLKDGCN